MSKSTLLEKMTDKLYRDAFVADGIDVGIPMQLRSMRESRGWKQSYVAEKTNTKQPRFSLMEKLGYGNFSLNTLKKLASLFDVGLIVSFVPFGEMIDFVEGMSERRLNAIGFAEEYPRLLRRYSRTSLQQVDTAQGSFEFAESTTTPTLETVSTGSPVLSVTTHTEPAEGEIENFSTSRIPYYMAYAVAGENTDAYQ
jgi:transcriptional regulator with XRE-family HTH domain